jgi:predicted 3-demethylubiquinone-9 3-methyltransferase (glyoxalase superfamily)
MKKVTPFLWFDDKAEEAMNFYVSIFKDSKIVSISRSPDEARVAGGTFQIDGQEFFALDGGPRHKFTPAISLFVDCETQQEADDLREKLSAGGKKDRCGWLTDKYGLSWEIIPSVLTKLLYDKDPEKSKRVRDATLKMGKLDINALEEAYRQS